MLVQKTRGREGFEETLLQSREVAGKTGQQAAKDQVATLDDRKEWRRGEAGPELTKNFPSTGDEQRRGRS